MRVFVVGFVFVLAVTGVAGGDPLSVDPTGRLTPDNLNRVCEVRIERYVNGFWAEAYRYTPEQKDQIRAHFQALKNRQIRYSLEMAAERNELDRKGKRELREKRGPETRPSEEFHRIISRLQEINKGDIIFRPEVAQKEVESLLPPDQVTAGRERLKELNAKMAEKMRRRNVGHQLGYSNIAAREGTVRVFEPDGWERYVERFCRAFGLNEGQRASAHSALRLAVQERNIYQARHEAEWKAIEQGVLDGHDMMLAGLEIIFDNMKAKLDAIPTPPQIKAASEKFHGQVTTRPTDMTSIHYQDPSGAPTTRPAHIHPADREEGRIYLIR